MTRAIVIPFHKYTPFGGEFYEPILAFFLKSMQIYAGEYDKLYLIDSDWGIPESKNYTVLKKELDGHHWVQFKWAIPKIKEDSMLFLDNDVIIYKKGIINNWFKKIDEGYDFVGSFDGSGTSKEVEKYPFLTKNDYKRMGSYYFILTKKLLAKIPDYDFAPVPEEGFDSFGKFTLQLLDTDPKIWEIKDDRSEFDGEKPQADLGYYHVRAGSRIAYLLASKHYDHENDYWGNINTQPKSEILRQCLWYRYMGGDPSEIEEDLNG